ncbi:hemerythrin domain-containing protein [Intrasporangium sp. DVR]|uniref:hemerythrin domain-containing protein n=1 Tax=Intrasporangium sp. DVR TaxID=3127867 RepID=UPI00313A5A25
MDASSDTTMFPATPATAESAPTDQGTTTNGEFTEHIERVRAHRAELRDAVTGLDRALEAPIAQGDAWRDRVRGALSELAHDFDDHIAITESSGGIYDRAMRTAPRLSGAVNRLLAEHEAFHEQIHRHLSALEQGAQLPDLSAFREELTTLVGRLVRHRQAGGDLVYEAYNVDLGGMG